MKHKGRHVLESIRGQFGFGILSQENGYYRLVFQEKQHLLDIITICSKNLKQRPELKLDFDLWAHGALDNCAWPIKTDYCFELTFILFCSGAGWFLFLLWKKSPILFFFLMVFYFVSIYHGYAHE